MWCSHELTEGSDNTLLLAQGAAVALPGLWADHRHEGDPKHVQSLKEIIIKCFQWLYYW